MLIAIVNAVDIMIRIQKTSGGLKMHSSRKDSLESIMTLVKIEYEPTEANFGTTTI